MFRDIKIFNNKEIIKYNYQIDDGILLISIENLNDKQCESLKLVYDENVYQINLSNNIKYENLKSGEILFYLENNIHSFSFKVDINYKFFVKTVYKYMNNFIDKDALIQEIELFAKTKTGKKYNSELIKLLNKIKKNLSVEENDKENQITNMLLNDNLYLHLANQMNIQDLMLLITSYISAPVLPKISQEIFNELVNAAINYDHSLENVWRLGMNYDLRNYNYNLLDEFFVNSKDSWYLAEYISEVIQVDQEKIVDMLIQTNDKEFIEKILKDNFTQSNLEEKYKNVLERALSDQEN